MTTDNFSLILFIFGMFCVLMGFGIGTFGTPLIKEVPIIEYIPINHTIERVEVKECALSCVDARNEGYLDGVAECDLHEAYITALDGRIRSLDNLEAFWNTRGLICVKTQGRTTDEVLSAFIHEMIHRDIYEFETEHFCEVTP